MAGRIDSKVKEVISSRRRTAEELAFFNLNNALLNSDFKKLYTKEKFLITQIAKDEFEGKDTKALRKEFNEIIKETELALTDLKMTRMDLEPHYSCIECDDSGMKNGSFCSCYKKLKSKLLLKESGFVNELPSFNDATTIENALYSKMEKWCETYEKSNIMFLIFSGSTGVGKTYLAQCMASELLKNNKYVLFTSAFNFNNNILKYHTTFTEEKNNYLEPFLDCDVLFIDDLGSEQILKNVTIEYLFLILNERDIKNKPTVITTNLNIEEFAERYGDRIRSRAINKKRGIALEIKGKDLRIKG